MEGAELNTCHSFRRVLHIIRFPGSSTYFNANSRWRSRSRTGADSLPSKAAATPTHKTIVCSYRRFAFESRMSLFMLCATRASDFEWKIEMQKQRVFWSKQFAVADVCRCLSESRQLAFASVDRMRQSCERQGRREDGSK